MLKKVGRNSQIKFFLQEGSKREVVDLLKYSMWIVEKFVKIQPSTF